MLHGLVRRMQTKLLVGRSLHIKLTKLECSFLYGDRKNNDNKLELQKTQQI